MVRALYRHIQLMLYRPFLPLSRPGKQTISSDHRGKKFATSCITVCSNVLRLVRDMAAENLLNGAHWFELTTLFNATTLAIFLRVSDPDNMRTKFLFKEAEVGRDVLTMLSDRSRLASRGLETVNVSTRPPCLVRRVRLIAYPAISVNA